ncbi:MAG: hypothetical protein ABI411_11210 [Tahibacter sp.]
MAALLALTTAGCAFDHRKQIAYNLLYRPDGMEYNAVFSAALNARFPPGSPVTDLEKFTSAVGGECHTNPPGPEVCEFQTRGSFCRVRLITIHVTARTGNIEAIRLHVGGLGC